MNSKNVAIVAVVAVIVIAAAAFVVLSKDKGDDKSPTEGIVIIDSLDNEIVIGDPVESVVVISGNEAEFFQILGLEDKIVGASQTVFNNASGYKDDMLDSVKNVGKYNGDAIKENIVATHAKYVLTPTSMGLKEATIADLKNTYQITTIVLECYGETMLRDAEQIVKMFASDSAKEKLDEYVSNYNEVKSKAIEASKDLDFTFLALSPASGSMSGYYTDNSEQAKNIKQLNGRNSLSEWYDKGLDISKTLANPSPESVATQSQTVGIDYYLVRGSSSSSMEDRATSAIAELNDYASSVKTIQEGNMYVIHSDAASGCRDFIGFVVYAEILGAELDLDPVKLINDFNEKYGFKTTYTALSYHYVPSS